MRPCPVKVITILQHCGLVKVIMILQHWGIQLHHLTPNSILHISIFVHLCEIFLGIHPHFDLFKSLFFLNPHSNVRNIARVGGADLNFTQKYKYIPYTPRRQIGDWRAEWFYIDNHAPAIPERCPGPLNNVSSGLLMVKTRSKRMNCCNGLLL